MKIERAWAIAGSLIVASCGGSVMHLGDMGPDGGTTSSSSAAGSGGSTGSSSGSSGAGGTIVSSGAGGSAIVPDCNTAGPSQPLWLTNSQYDNTLRDLLGYGYDGPSLAGAAMLPSDTIDIGFRRQTQDPLGHTGDSQLRLAGFMRAAQLATEWARSHLNQVVGCDSAALGEDACADQFVTGFGMRGYRHPLTSVERNELKSAYNDGRAMGSFADGILGVIGKVLVSPQFLRIEVPGARGSVGPLEPYAIASRLSYFIYRSMPDQPLFDAAASGKLATKEDVALQAVRMLGDPRAHVAVRAFFTEWLSLDGLVDGSVGKDASLYPEFETLRGDMRTETRMFGEDVFFGAGLLSKLLTSEFTEMNQPLAKLYGVPGLTGLDFARTNVDNKTRSGILTHASFLSMTSNAIASSPTKRGSFVNRQLLCRVLPAPPSSVDRTPPSDPGKSTRENYSIHETNPACASCHKMIDGIGFGFEEYDAIGRYRTTDNGRPIDASGTILGLDDAAQVDFIGAVDLSAKLAASRDVRDCVARQWFHFALERDDVDEDACSLTAIQRDFRQSANMRDLVVAIATSTSFRYGHW